jgi:HAD superfamily hydrolase (TIGR01490 family)
MTMRKFAAFDIDGTVGRNSIFTAVTDELVRSGHLPAEVAPKVEEKLEAYRQRKHKETFNEYVEASVNALFAHMNKVSVKDYQAAVDRVMAKQKLYSYVFTRDLIKKLKAEGYFLIALSGSEMYGVQQFCEHYGFDLAIGETYHEKNGYFTGEVENVIYGKGVLLKKLVKEHGLDFKDSYAVGDSKSDAKMLELVENPIAFNPEARLLDIATANQWKIVIERKNVIYELRHSKNGYKLEY